MKTIVFALALVSTSLAMASRCPVKSTDPRFEARLETRIALAKTCNEAATIAHDCTLHSGRDLTTTSAAVTRCEKDFVETVSTSDLEFYIKLSDKCAARFQTDERSPHAGFVGSCRLQVAQLYARLMSAVSENQK